jgi:membrane-anchored mycosin MYCP
VLGLGVLVGPVVPAAANTAKPPEAACRHNDPAVRKMMISATDATKTTWPEQYLDYRAVQRYSTGAGIRVAVVDSGVDAAQEQLRGRVEAGVDVTGGRAVAGADTDCAGHGTMVAGIIAAQPFVKRAFVGIAPGVKIIPVRETWGVDANGQDVSAPAADLVRAMQAAVTSGASVVNVSIVVPEAALTAAEKAEFLRVARVAEENDVLIVAAAGNRKAFENQNYPNNNPATYPAALSTVSPNVMAVSGITVNGTPDSDSISGPFVSVAAPDQADSATPWDNPCTMDRGGLVPCSGTSFAAPFVSGLAALVRSRFPTMTAAQTKERIQSTADHPSAAMPDPQYGFGVIDPSAALTADVAPSATAAAPVAAPPFSPAPAGQGNAGITAAVAAGSLGVVVAVLAGWFTIRRGRRRAWRPGRIPTDGRSGAEPKDQATVS